MLNKYKFLEKMADAGYTQQALADKLNISKGTLNAKINGHSYFNTKQIDTICDILQITNDNDKIQIFLASSFQNRNVANNRREISNNRP